MPCAAGTFWVDRVGEGDGGQPVQLRLLVLRHWWWWWRWRVLLQWAVDMVLTAVLALFGCFGLSACCVTLGHCTRI